MRSCLFIREKTYKTKFRNYRLNRNGNFCKGTQVSQIIAGAKVCALAVSLKQSTGFFCMSVTESLLCFGGFAAGKHVNGCFFLAQMYISIDFCKLLKYMIDLLSCASSRLRQKFNVQVPPRKNGTLFGFFDSHSFLCPCAS